MLVSSRLSRPLTVSRRAAFTLVEVLVVVAIVVILASVGTIATLKFLDDAKVDTARAKAEQIVTYGKTWSTRNDGQQIPSLDVLVTYADNGTQAFIDPWGNQYQYQYVEDPNAAYPRLFVYTMARVDGADKYVGAPRDLEMQMNQGR